MRKAGGDGKDTVMATPVEVDNELSSQENKDETSLVSISLHSFVLSILG